MAELQAGLAARALRIDFDRWDCDEWRQNSPVLDPALIEKDEYAEQQQKYEEQPESEGLPSGPFPRPNDGSVGVRART
jgi:hypothetical protein